MRVSLATLGVVLAGSLVTAQTFPCYETNLGTNLNLGDDQVAQNNALGFTFPGPGGVSVTSIDVSSNGFVWLASNANPRCCQGEVNKFLTQSPSIAPFWVDLNPAAAGAGGGVFFNTFPASGSVPARAVVTWSQVPEFNGSIQFTFQMQIDSTGAIFFYWDPNVANNNRVMLCGVSEGNANPGGSAQANWVDISTATPPLDTGTNPTFHEEMWFFDMANRTLSIVPNGNGGYTISDPTHCQPAAWSKYGGGCPREPVFYEHFVAPNALDLSNSAILVLPNGSGGWLATSTTGFYTPTSPPIPTGDDWVTGPFALPWTWSWSGGSTTSIDVSSNGFIWLNSGNGNSRCCSGDPGQLLFDPASICAHWMDHNPNSGGTIHVDTDPVANEVHITWMNIAEYGSPSTTSTFQITLMPSNSFRLSYQNVGAPFHDSLTGFGPGNAIADPGSMDLSASLPFDTGPGGVPLVLDAVAGARPQIGTTFTLELLNAPVTSPIGLMIFGFGQVFPGVDLGFLGMPGCLQFTSFDVTLAFPLVPTPQFAFPLPYNTALVGVNLYTQGATLAPGVNPLGVIMSNGGAMTVGI